MSENFHQRRTNDLTTVSIILSFSSASGA